MLTATQAAALLGIAPSGVCGNDLALDVHHFDGRVMRAGVVFRPCAIRAQPGHGAIAMRGQVAYNDLDGFSLHRGRAKGAADSGLE